MKANIIQSFIIDTTTVSDTFGDGKTLNVIMISIDEYLKK